MSAVTQQIAALEARLASLYAQADAEADLFERFPDEHDEGSVLVWEKQFTPGGQTYTFAAIKAGGLWYVTGKWQVGLLWPAFVEKFLADAQSVWVVTTMEAV